MQEDFIEELQEEFRVFEYQQDGNEQAFKSLFNEIKQSKQFYYHCLRQYQESKSTSDQSTHIETLKSLPQDNTVKLEIEVEEQKAKQLQNLIQEMEHKIKDKRKQTEKLKTNLMKLKLYERVSHSEEHEWKQIQQEQKSQQELQQEFLNLQKGIQQVEKQKIKKQYKKINKEISILQNEYITFRNKESEMRKIMHQQQMEIQQLTMHYQSVSNKKQEQYSTIFYANTLKLLEEIFCFSDPRSILKYQLEQRNSKAKIKYHNNQEIDLFPTQILQQEDNDEEELDQYLLDLIKQGNEDITNFQLDEEIISFTEFMIQTLNEFKFNFETYSNIFQQLNEKKQSLKEDLKKLVYFKYSETSNGLLEQNNKVSTVNILSSTMLNNNQIDNSTSQRLQDQACKTQKLVLRLYNFIRNHIIRINNLFLNMQKCSNLIPDFLIKKSEITKLNFLSNETIKTPVKQPKQSMTTSILNFEVGKELQIAKHSKLLANKSMTSTVYMPRKSKLASHLGLFKYQSAIQQYMKQLVQDEIDRLFVSQDLFDEFQKEVNRLCTSSDPTNEELEKILKNQEQLFRFKLKQRLTKQLQIGLQDLGEIFNKVQREIKNLKQKGFTVQQQRYSMGTFLNVESYHSQGRTQYNSQFNSNPTSQDMSIKLDSQKELVQFMRRLTKQTIEMQSNRQEDDDSFEQERARVKQNMYFVKNNVTQQQKYVQNQDVFQRLLPKTEQIRNFFIEQQLNSLRKDRLKIVGAKSQNTSGMEIQNSVIRMKHSSERQQQQNKYKSHNTFRQLFTSPVKKNKEQSQSQNKLSSVRQSQTSHQILRPHNESDDVVSIWKKKHRAKRILNAISNKIGERNILQKTDLQTYI